MSAWVSTFLACTHPAAAGTPTTSITKNRMDWKKPPTRVTSAIIAIYREACTLPVVKLGSRKAEMFFSQRDFSRYWWKHDIETKLSRLDTIMAQGRLNASRRNARENETYQTDVAVFRMGILPWSGCRGRCSWNFELMIKERSRLPKDLVSSYTNDYAGYVATRQAFIGGSYEVWPSLNARISREGGYVMVELKLIELLEDLYDEQTEGRAGRT